MLQAGLKKVLSGHLGESHVDISTGQVPVTNSESFAWWASQGKLIANYKKNLQDLHWANKIGGCLSNEQVRIQVTGFLKPCVVLSTAYLCFYEFFK